MKLTERQACILKAVVEEHHASGRPVGSRTLVERGAVDASPSTVRYELGRLEQLGLLEHPHTSAGRVPTDLGYRVYVDHLLDPAAASGLPARQRSLLPDETAPQVDEAIRVTTQALAEVTELLSVVTSPSAGGASIRHVELLQLQPTMLVVVVITAAGDVSRHVVPTQAPVDPGLVDWAAEYLNEQVAGLSPGQHLLRQRLARSDLSPAERAMLALVSPAFTALADAAQDVHVGGSAPLLARLGSDVQRVVNLVAMLDERSRLLDALRPLVEHGVPRAHAAAARAVAVRIGTENDIPELQRLSVVGASYGVGARSLGMVGVIGPRSMDYTLAMSAVRAAATGLSTLAEDVYDA